ncbi:MAG: sugar ABC transporter substrate-binding protein [Treponema sp.]|jgi:multiple sugar transport system substrate-binding protein|nr:sugar ABC transporter substrate-binding protein [Treponema sp.]
MKKGVFLLACAAALMCLSACQKQHAPGQAQSASAGDVTLKLGIWDKNQEGGITQVLKDFTAQTGVKVEVEITPWEQYWTLLEAAATGGALPDVFWMHSNQVIRYESSGLLMDLTERIENSDIADLANFPPDLVGLYSLNGRNYAIPKDLDTIALFYNKKIFDEMGVAYPTDQWSWDDFADAARRLTNEEHYGYAAALFGQEGYFNFIFQNDGWVISEDKKTSGFDDPKTIEAVQFFVDFVRNGSSPDLSVTAENTPAALLEAGKVAMGTFGSWMLSEFKSNEYVAANCDIQLLPKGRDGTRATVYNGLGWVAAANTEHPEEAWKLLEFFSSREAQKKLSATGIAISAFLGASDAWYKTSDLFNLKAYADQIPYGRFYPFSRNAVVWHNMIDEKLRDALSGITSVPDACRDITRTMNQMLAAEQ